MQGRQLDQFLRYLDSLLKPAGRSSHPVSGHLLRYHVCLRTGVLGCLDDASLHLDFTFVSLVSGHPRPPVVTAPVYRGCPSRAPLGCLRCPGRMSIGSRAPTLVVALCRWWWTCHVDVPHTRVLQAPSEESCNYFEVSEKYTLSSRKEQTCIPSVLALSEYHQTLKWSKVTHRIFVIHTVFNSSLICCLHESGESNSCLRMFLQNFSQTPSATPISRCPSDVIRLLLFRLDRDDVPSL